MNRKQSESELDMIKRAMQKAEEEKSLPAFPLPYTSPFPLVMQAHFQRQKLENRLSKIDKAGNRNEKGEIRNTFIGQEAHFSSTPLHELNRVLLQDMKVRERQKGKYLLGRIIAPPFRIIATSLVIEDPKGWSQIISVYNYPGTYSACGPELDAIFPLNTVIAIREPQPKMALLASHSHIRVDSPTDIIILEPGNQLLANVSWSTGSRPLPVLTKTANEWKATGDQHFKFKQYYAAIATYTLSLQRNPSLVAVRLNRALAYLRIKNYNGAIKDAEHVLSVQDLSAADRSKALYRCAQGTYGKASYIEAKEWYLKCIKTNEALKEAVVGVEKCDARLQEQTLGVYDWYSIFKAEESPHPISDIAEYIGPVERVSMQHRGGGRGIRATRKITAGELLVVSKSFASGSSKNFSPEGPFFAMNFLTKHMDSENHYVAIQRAIERMLSSHRDATDLLDLYGGPQYDPTEYTSGDLPPPETLIMTRDLDSARVQAICSLNMFGSAPRDDLFTQSPNSNTALHIFPSYFNHSCIPNGIWHLLGDIMYIRAVRVIKKGEEITLGYANQSAGYEKRKKSLKKWFPRCDCPLCDQDRSDGEIRCQEREDIVKRAQVSKLGINELRALSKEINQTYTTGHGTFRPAASLVHQALAQALQREAFHLLDSGRPGIRASSLLKSCVLEQFSALETLGVRILDKSVENIPLSKKDGLPISRDYMPYNVDECIPMCLDLSGGFYSKGELAEAERWMRAAIWIENGSKGGGIKLFKSRWEKPLTCMGDEAAALLASIEEPK